MEAMNARLGTLLLALALLVTGCHAHGGGRGAGVYGGAGQPVLVVPADAYGRTIDHLGRRIPQG